MTDRRILWAIFFVALALRLAAWGYLAQFHNGLMHPDSWGYESRAGALLVNGEFGVGLDQPGRLDTHRTPGYPLFLALCGNSRTTVAATQCLLGAITVLFVFGIGRRLGGDKAGYLAATIMAIDPLGVIYGPKILTETLAVFVFAAGIFALLHERWRWWFAPCVIVLPFIRPIFEPVTGWLTVLVVIGGGMWHIVIAVRDERRFAEKEWLQAWFPVAIGLCFAVSAILFWTARNRAIEPEAGFSTVDGYVLLYNFAPKMKALDRGEDQQSGRDYLRARIEVMKEFESETGIPSRRELWTADKSGPAKQWVKERYLYPNIHHLPEMVFDGVSHTLRGDALTDTILLKSGRLGPWGWILEIERLGNNVHYVFAFVGFVLLCARRETRWWAILFALASAYLLIVPTPVTSAVYRFRAPVAPILAVFSGCGLALMWNRLRQGGGGELER